MQVPLRTDIAEPSIISDHGGGSPESSNVAEKKWNNAYGGLDVLKDECYLKQILFNRSCRSGRQVADSL